MQTKEIIDDEDYCATTGELFEECECWDCLAEREQLARQQEADWAHLDGIDYL